MEVEAVVRSGLLTVTSGASERGSKFRDVLSANEPEPTAESTVPLSSSSSSLACRGGGSTVSSVGKANSYQLRNHWHNKAAKYVEV